MTVLIHVRIPDPTIDMIDRVVEGKNITDKVRNYICSNYLTKEFLVRQKAEYESKLKTINQALKENPFFNRDILSDAEKTFLIETISVIKRKPETIYSRTDLFNNMFGKHMSQKDFKLLLYEFKEEQAKKK